MNRSNIQLMKIVDVFYQSMSLKTKQGLYLHQLAYKYIIIFQMESINYRFDFENQAQWRKHLHEEGFVVIKNWISKDQCQNYVQQLWEIMEVLSDGKLDRNLPQTQISPENYPPVLQGGMVHYVGHSKPQWQLRKKLMPLFQKLWNSEQLKTSFDGFCFMNGLKNYQFSPINSFLHSDQSPTRNELWSYQGICHLTKSGKGEGGFVVAPKSNHYHHKYFEDKGLLDLKKDWFLIPQADKSLQYLKCVKLNTQAGDFTIFDSRTFHSSTVPYEKVLRVCTYICMLPSTNIPEEVLQARKSAAEAKAVSSHQPGDGFRTFPTLPFSVDADRFSVLLKKVNNYDFDNEIINLI